MNSYSNSDDDNDCSKISANANSKIEHKDVNANILHDSKLIFLGTLAAGMAHEVNNPLAVIVCATEMLQKLCKNHCDGYHGFHAKDLFADILISANTIASIIREFKTFARPDTDAVTSVNVNQCIRDVLCLFNLINKHESIKIETHFTTKDAIIDFNEGKMHQVIANIVSNAIDALLNKEFGLIKITTSEKDENFLLVVEDNGVGIVEEDIPKLFDPFFTTKTADKGTGLGLHICHLIVSSFAGSIHIESKVGVGTIITVILPKKH